MKTSEQRINNIIGQLEGIKKMLATPERNCFDIIVQLKAAKSALGSLLEQVISAELNQCLPDERLQENNKIAKIFKEVINN